MRPVTREEMQRLDRMAIEVYSIPAIRLMENAGVAACDVLCREFPRGDAEAFPRTCLLIGVPSAIPFRASVLASPHSSDSSV